MQIFDLKIQHKEVIKENENFSNQLQDREAYYVRLENGLASLRCELEKENNHLYRYQKLEKIRE